MSKKILTATLLLFFTLSISANAGEAKPINISLFNPIQIVSEGQAVKGIRLSLLYGKNTSVTGLDWGFG